MISSVLKASLISPLPGSALAREQKAKGRVVTPETNREVPEGPLGTGDQGSGDWDESALTSESMECGEGATSLGVCVCLCVY